MKGILSVSLGWLLSDAIIIPEGPSLFLPLFIIALPYNLSRFVGSILVHVVKTNRV